MRGTRRFTPHLCSRFYGFLSWVSGIETFLLEVDFAIGFARSQGIALLVALLVLMMLFMDELILGCFLLFPVSNHQANNDWTHYCISLLLLRVLILLVFVCVLCICITKKMGLLWTCDAF